MVMRQPTAAVLIATLAWTTLVVAAGAAPHCPSPAQNIVRMTELPTNRRRTTTSMASRTCAFLPRGGSTTTKTSPQDDDEEDEETRKKREEQRIIVQKWRMDQHVLLQLRATFLSEALAARGVPISTMMDVSTADGDRPPESIDWDCAMSTVDEPKTCLYSFDAEPNTKVIAPISTKQWISLSALNRLRRTDPTKVEPMWHSRYSILKSWFHDTSEYSVMQHVGFRGFMISAVLLDLGKGVVLKSVLALSILSVLIICMPLLEYCVNRMLVSGPFWAQWKTWSRITHAALPLKLLIGQLAWKFVVGSFNKLENKVREYVVDLECSILEESIPLTVGPGSEEVVDDDNEEEEDSFREEEENGSSSSDENMDFDEEEDDEYDDNDGW